MGKAQGRERPIGFGKAGKGVEDADQLIPNQDQALPHQYNVCVVPHIAACGAQMDDGHRLGALCAVGVNMSHDVVAQLLLFFRRHLVVDIVYVGLQLLHLLLRNRQTKLHLRPRKSHPQPAPGRKLFVG